MATDYVLSFKDDRTLGTFAEVEAMLRAIVPDLVFGWRTSGPEKIRLAAERGIEFPPAVREHLQSFPALYEAVAEGDGYYVEFCLGPSEPVTELVVEPRGDHPELHQWLRELEARVGTTLRIYGEPATD